VFSVRGPVVVPLRASQAYLLGFFNSRLVRALIEMQTASQTYTSGVLKELRWVDPDEGTRRIVEDAATGAFTEVRMRLATEETDPFFEGLLVRNDGVVPQTLPAYFAWRRWFIESLKERLFGFQAVIDDEIAKLYGVSQADIERCERVETRSEMPQRFPPEFGFAMPAAEALMSYLFGIAIGRWSFHVVEAVPRLDAAAPPVQPAGSPDPSAIAISVDDPGHRDDIVSLARCALEKAFQPSDADMALLERELGSSLRAWFAKIFFTKHLACYTAFGRTAPVYWQLSTPSASYSVWLYVHAFTRDTIYKVYNDFVTPKLALEERNLDTLRHEFGNSPSAEQRKRLVTQELFVDELRAFRKEVELIAPLWNPNLDDGVLINFSPLWRLVPHHKAWQKQLREMWDALCGEKCDWAHLAMHLWPERVVQKCVTDRSLAIAHGLDDVFWIQGDDRKWKPRSLPTRPVEDLVRERLSPAVKAALGNLLEASGVVKNTGGRDQGFARTAEGERVS
jgi:hypothetical protein